MKRFHFSIFIITVLLTLLALPLLVKAQVTLTVDGKPFPFDTMVVNITTDTPEPPIPPVEPPIPPIEPPIEPPIDPPTDCGATPPNVIGNTWLNFWGVAFPNPKSKQLTVSIPGRSIYSIAFNTGSVNGTGSVRNFEATSAVGSRQISISRCPGDFVNIPDVCWRWVGTTQRAVPWATNGAPGGYCQLENNTTYYWNTKWDSQLGCTGSVCQTNLRVFRR